MTNQLIAFLTGLLLVAGSGTARGQSPAETDSMLKIVQLLPATVSAIQAPERAPFPTQTFEAAELAKRDASMDMPFLLRFTPS